LCGGIPTGSQEYRVAQKVSDYPIKKIALNRIEA